MKRFQLRRARKLMNNRRWIVPVSISGVVLALVVALAITAVSRGRYVAALADSRENLAASVHGSLNVVARAFEQMPLPGSDEAALIASMRDNLLIAKALNKALVDGYGVDASVLSDELFRSIEDNISTLGDTIAMGRTLDDARAAMAACLGEVQTALTARFPGENDMRFVAST